MATNISKDRKMARVAKINHMLASMTEPMLLMQIVAASGLDKAWVSVNLGWLAGSHVIKHENKMWEAIQREFKFEDYDKYLMAPSYKDKTSHILDLLKDKYILQSRMMRKDRQNGKSKVNIGSSFNMV